MKKEEKLYDAALLWTLSDRCNLDCSYCFSKNTTNKKINKINIRPFLMTLKRSKKKFLIVLTGGGEPFLVNNFISLCKNITKDHYISLITNLTSNKIEEFAKSIDPKKVVGITVSMHLEELEKKGLMELFIKNLEIIEKRGYNIMVTEVAYPGLIKDFEKYKKFIQRMGIKLEYFPYFGVYKNKDYPKSYSDKELEFFGLKDSIKHKRIFQYNKLCNAGYNIAFAKANGDIEVCTSLPINIGNVYKNIKFRNRLIRCSKKICSCPMNEYTDIYLYNKARNETKKSIPIKYKESHIKIILKYLDRKIGLLGQSIKKISPVFYGLLKNMTK